jgi:ATP synthase protein I
MFVLSITAVTYPMFGKGASLGLLLGGCIFCIPNAVFSWMAFRHVGATKTKLVMRNIYVGEALKIALTAGLFIAVLTLIQVHLLALYLGFIVLMLTQWLTPVFFHHKTRMTNGCTW